MSTAAHKVSALAVLVLVCPLALGPGLCFFVPRRSFIEGKQRSRGSEDLAFPCRRRASREGCAEELRAASSVQLPEANYFTNIAAAQCLEEGCSIFEAKAIYARLQRDEPRIEESIEHLQAASKAAGVARNTEEEIRWLRDFLSESRVVRKKLESVFGFSGSETVENFFGAFAHVPTAGLLGLRPTAAVQ
mmetsp:Transcript_52651/g.122555  ORF Transcript_52651/g.122555 Transcript_52651/m.122555 type:complete len:190 (-) Transcript_52651:46-615(-)